MAQFGSSVLESDLNFDPVALESLESVAEHVPCLRIEHLKHSIVLVPHLDAR